MDVGVGLVVLGCPFEFEHLDLNSSCEASSFCGFGFAPEECSGVSAWFHVTPFDFHDEVFVMAIGSHYADGMAGADEDAVFYGPCVVCGVYVYPAGEVGAIEDVNELHWFGG